jgi:hypothetical protein
MRAITFGLYASLLCISAVSWASGQVSQETRKEELKAVPQRPDTQPDPRSAASSGAPAPGVIKKDEPSIFVYLVNGGRLQVEEVRETNEGVWYKQGNLTSLLDSKQVARVERPSATQTAPPSLHLQNSISWTILDSAKVQRFFMTKFGRQLPTTAFGQSDLHNRWGLDHRQGIDVGLHPDSPEGVALVEFLRSEKIPFLVFRNSVPGVATGPHIHIGNPSHRILPR